VARAANLRGALFAYGRTSARRGRPLCANPAVCEHHYHNYLVLVNEWCCRQAVWGCMRGRRLSFLQNSFANLLIVEPPYSWSQVPSLYGKSAGSVVLQRKSY